ncbi:hypothetical protein L3Q82_013482 [Scortum barcoo]|uniref:Uncharacterized protein n=1 Tax=Scortum barcoo TaxID=214431 RepID=A0ACB8W0H5_9TELE|nr:hypothetical protein L3Q82_013482 [Scortum barcoo]
MRREREREREDTVSPQDSLTALGSSFSELAAPSTLCEGEVPQVLPACCCQTTQQTKCPLCDQDLQRVLERFAADCEAAGAGIGICSSKSEAMVLDRKRVACPLRVGGEVLPQVEEFKYLGVLFTSEGKMEVRLTGGLVCSVRSYAGQCTGLSW